MLVFFGGGVEGCVCPMGYIHMADVWYLTYVGRADRETLRWAGAAGFSPARLR